MQGHPLEGANLNFRYRQSESRVSTDRGVVEPRTMQPPGTEGCVLPGTHTGSARATMGDLTVLSDNDWAALEGERREGGREVKGSKGGRQ